MPRRKYSRSPCQCKPDFDVRCCCEYNCPSKNTIWDFQLCPMRIQTTIFTINNDYNFYCMAQKNDFKFLRKLLKNSEDRKEVIKLYKEEEEENARSQLME
jgi:hypothetical protein